MYGVSFPCRNIAGPQDLVDKEFIPLLRSKIVTLRRLGVPTGQQCNHDKTFVQLVTWQELPGELPFVQGQNLMTSCVARKWIGLDASSCNSGSFRPVQLGRRSGGGVKMQRELHAEKT